MSATGGCRFRQLSIRWAMTSVSVAEWNDVALALQPLLDGLKVLDHAVVDHGQRAIAAEMRMGVDVGRRAVRRPAGVADADPAGGRVVGQQGFEPVDSAGRLDHGELAARA